MAVITFSALPTEVQVSIARHCENNDLINLCLTSKWVNERCFHVLYRSVDVQLNHDLGYYGYSVVKVCDQMMDVIKRQQQFFRTLLSHPEYGKHVRIWKGTLFLPRFYESDNDAENWEEAMIPEEKVWCAMQSLTHVQSVDLGSKFKNINCRMAEAKQIPNSLFRSATSVRLAGEMQYGLAKSILNAVNPATLRHLCLDMVQDRRYPGQPEPEYRPGDRGEDGRIMAFGATTGLLTKLTGRCTALRTLILRRIGQGIRFAQEGQHWHAVAEESSYIEWASFIHSVQGTLENFTFEQIGEHLGERLMNSILSDQTGPFRIMDERFRQFVLPTIISGNWPYLTNMEVRGVRDWTGPSATGALMMELRAVLGEHTNIVVEEVYTPPLPSKDHWDETNPAPRRF